MRILAYGGATMGGKQITAFVNIYDKDAMVAFGFPQGVNMASFPLLSSVNGVSKFNALSEGATIAAFRVNGESKTRFSGYGKVGITDFKYLKGSAKIAMKSMLEQITLSKATSGVAISGQTAGKPFSASLGRVGFLNKMSTQRGSARVYGFANLATRSLNVRASVRGHMYFKNAVGTFTSKVITINLVSTATGKLSVSLAGTGGLVIAKSAMGPMTKTGVPVRFVASTTGGETGTIRVRARGEGMINGHRAAISYRYTKVRGMHSQSSAAFHTKTVRVRELVKSPQADLRTFKNAKVVFSNYDTKRFKAGLTVVGDVVRIGGAHVMKYLKRAFNLNVKGLARTAAWYPIVGMGSSTMSRRGYAVRSSINAVITKSIMMGPHQMLRVTMKKMRGVFWKMNKLAHTQFKVSGDLASVVAGGTYTNADLRVFPGGAFSLRGRLDKTRVPFHITSGHACKASKAGIAMPAAWRKATEGKGIQRRIADDQAAVKASKASRKKSKLAKAGVLCKIARARLHAWIKRPVKRQDDNVKVTALKLRVRQFCGTARLSFSEALEMVQAAPALTKPKGGTEGTLRRDSKKIPIQAPGSKKKLYFTKTENTHMIAWIGPVDHTKLAMFKKKQAGKALAKQLTLVGGATVAIATHQTKLCLDKAIKVGVQYAHTGVTAFAKTTVVPKSKLASLVSGFGLAGKTAGHLNAAMRFMPAMMTVDVFPASIAPTASIGTLKSGKSVVMDLMMSPMKAVVTVPLKGAPSAFLVGDIKTKRSMAGTFCFPSTRINLQSGGSYHLVRTINPKYAACGRRNAQLLKPTGWVTLAVIKRGDTVRGGIHWRVSRTAATLHRLFATRLAPVWSTESGRVLLRLYQKFALERVAKTPTAPLVMQLGVLGGKPIHVKSKRYTYKFNEEGITSRLPFKFTKALINIGVPMNLGNNRIHVTLRVPWKALMSTSGSASLSFGGKPTMNNQPAMIGKVLRVDYLSARVSPTGHHTTVTLKGLAHYRVTKGKTVLWHKMPLSGVVTKEAQVVLNVGAKTWRKAFGIEKMALSALRMQPVFDTASLMKCPGPCGISGFHVHAKAFINRVSKHTAHCEVKAKKASAKEMTAKSSLKRQFAAEKAQKVRYGSVYVRHSIPGSPRQEFRKFKTAPSAQRLMMIQEGAEGSSTSGASIQAKAYGYINSATGKFTFRVGSGQSVSFRVGGDAKSSLDDVRLALATSPGAILSNANNAMAKKFPFTAKLLKSSTGMLARFGGSLSTRLCKKTMKPAQTQNFAKKAHPKNTISLTPLLTPDPFLHIHPQPSTLTTIHHQRARACAARRFSLLSLC